MLSRFAKLLLVTTSLVPILLVIGVNKCANHGFGISTCSWFVVAACLVLLCLVIIGFARTNLQKNHTNITKIENADQEVLAFLLAYLLPLFAESKLGFEGDYVTGILIFAIIFICVYNSNSYHFNPLLGIFGYHFYKVETGYSANVVLVSKKTIRRTSSAVQTVQLSEYIFLEI